MGAFLLKFLLEVIMGSQGKKGYFRRPFSGSFYDGNTTNRPFCSKIKAKTGLPISDTERNRRLNRMRWFGLFFVIVTILFLLLVAVII